MKKRVFSILWWYLVSAALSVLLLENAAAAAVSKSSTSKRNNKSKLLSSDKNGLGKDDESSKAGEEDVTAIVKGGGDIIPIPDHLSNSDYEHYSYQENEFEDLPHEYDYEDDYPFNTGKHNKQVYYIVNTHNSCTLNRLKIDV